MKRLIADAAELSDTVDAQDMSFANIVKAINVVQTEMGITGTTAKEAASTIQGSVGKMKSSWTNLVTGLADENANLDVLISNFVDSVGTVAQNIVPKIGVALNSASKLISDLIPVIVQEIPTLIEENLPILAEAAISIVRSLVDGISENQEMLMTTAFETITYLATSLINMLPQIVALGLDLLVSLANGITNSLPTLIPTIIDVVLQIVNTLTNPETLSNLVDASLAIIMSLADGLITALPGLIDQIPIIVDNIITILSENMPKIVEMGAVLLVELVGGIIKSIPNLIKAIPQIITSLVNGFTSYYSKIFDIGKNIIAGIKEGIANAWKNLVSWFESLFGDLVGIAKRILGIKSPSRVFRDQIGKQMAAGLGLGWEDEFGKVKQDIEDSLSFEDASVGISASVRRIGSGADRMAYSGNSFGDIIINIDGAKYNDEQSLAEAVAQAIQDMTDRRSAIYA